MAGATWEVVGGADKGGIIVRSGAATTSPELGARLSTGARLRQLERAGERLRYLRLSGEGPRCGWVSTKVKEKPLLAARDAAPPAGGAPAGAPERPLAVAVLGATGYTGGLICEHLDALLPAGAAWAIAGRSAERLEALGARLRTRPEVVLAESEAQLRDLAGRCRVLLSAAGPYAVCGEAAVSACLASGTDYVDITGEVYWVRQMIDKYGDAARDSGAALVSMCGQDSVPPDIAVNLLVQHLGPLKQARAYMFSAGAASGGTHQTGLTSWRAHPDLAFAAQNDPFHIGGLRRGKARPVDQDCCVPEQCPLFPKLWLGPAGTGQPDSRCVRRSAGLFDEAGEGPAYGDDFALVYRDAALSQKAAMDMLQACGPVPTAGFAPKVCKIMEDAVSEGRAPRPGGGAPPETRRLYGSTLVVVAEGEDGRWAHCEHTAPEAYEVTAISAVAAALTLCEERDALRALGRQGFMTPAFAFWGTSFVERLRGTAFAASPAGRRMGWQVREGRPAEEFMADLVRQRARTMGEAFAKFHQGELKPF